LTPQLNERKESGERVNCLLYALNPQSNAVDLFFVQNRYEFRSDSSQKPSSKRLHLLISSTNERLSKIAQIPQLAEQDDMVGRLEFPLLPPQEPILFFFRALQL
jgi:hypothetical protein